TRLLMKGLAKDREKRFQTGAEMAAALRAPEAWAARQQQMEAAADTPTINFTAPRATTTSPNSIVSALSANPTAAAAAPVATGELAKPRRSGLRLILGAVALLFALFVISVVGVFWYAAHTTRSASSEVDKAIKDATRSEE